MLSDGRSAGEYAAAPRVSAVAPFYWTIVPVGAPAVPCVGSDSGGTATDPDRALADAVSQRMRGVSL